MTRTSEVSPCVYNAPPHTETFGDEEVLKELLNWARTDAREQSKIFVLRGDEWFRVKTLAATVFHSVSQKNRIWLSGKSGSELKKRCKAFWLDLNPSENQYPIDVYTGKVRKWLESEQNYLLVIDHKTPSLNGNLPQRGGHILILSDHESLDENYVLEPLNENQAIDLVSGHLPQDENSALLVKTFGTTFYPTLVLAHTLGHIEIAISEFFAFWAQYDQSLVDFYLFQALSKLLKEKKPHHFQFLRFCHFFNQDGIPINELIQWNPEFKKIHSDLSMFFSMEKLNTLLDEAWVGIFSEVPRPFDLFEKLYEFFSQLPFFTPQLIKNLQTFKSQCLPKFQENPQKFVWVMEKLDAVAPNKHSRFFEAIQHQDRSEIQLFLEGGVDVNASNGHGYTALLWAIAHKLEDIVSLLIEKGADISHPTLEGVTPVHLAVFENAFGLLQILLDQHADCQTPAQNGLTPLNAACEKGHYQCVERLLQAGAATNDGSSSLFIALKNQDPKMVQLLLPVSALNNVYNKSGDTPLTYAVQHCSPHIVEILLEKGADPNATDYRGKTALDYATNEKIVELLKSAFAKNSS